MLEAFENLDYIGLEQYILQFARRQCQDGSAPNSYKLIVGDYEKKTGYVFILLHLLPPSVIRSLIRNTLPFDKTNDPDVKEFYDSEMAIQDSCAGVYIRWVCNAPGMVVSPASAAAEGKFLTSKQIQQMLDLVQEYLDNKASSESVNNTIDKFHDPLFQPNSARVRGKPIEGDTAAKIREWIAVVRTQFCTEIDTAKEEGTFLRVPMEVEWADEVPSHMKSHTHAAQTTPLLYIVNAIATEVFNLPNKEHSLLFPVPYNEDTNFYSIAEILGSILCSSHYTFGGLNIDLAGDSDMTTLDEDHDAWWASARYFNRRQERDNVTGEIDRLHKQVERLATARKLPALRQECEAAVVACEISIQERDAKAEEYRTILETLRQLQQKADQVGLERTTGEVDDETREISTLLEQFRRIERKQQIWVMLCECVDTEDEEKREANEDHLANLDQDLVAEVMQEFAEIQDKLLEEKEIREGGKGKEKEQAAG